MEGSLEIGAPRERVSSAGFAALLDRIDQRSRAGNDEGWAEELGELEEYLEAP